MIFEEPPALLSNLGLHPRGSFHRLSPPVHRFVSVVGSGYADESKIQTSLPVDPHAHSPRYW